MARVALPKPTGGSEILELRPPAQLRTVSTRPASRMAYAAAHVVANPLSARVGDGSDQIDWDETLLARHRIWDLGLGVAEAMDTAQRGAGLGWSDAMKLTKLTLSEAGSRGAEVVVGVSTDSITESTATLEQIAEAYTRDVATVAGHGGTAVLMASRHLSRAARSPEDFYKVYDQVLSQADRPVMLHWLGEAFDPSLHGYWGSEDIGTAMENVTAIIAQHHSKVAGIKVSLLDPAYEILLRERTSVPVFTGDDYNYVDMIAGDAQGFSHALLGAFSYLAPFASAALAKLDSGDEAGFREILTPTQPLSRLVFEAPTQFYKTGVVWIAYLTGQQPHFRMIGGFEAGRCLLHLAEIVRVANEIGLFPDPELAAHRAQRYFEVHGVV